MIHCNELPRYQYCDMYHIAESFAFYTFIYDTCYNFLISFPEPSYAKKKKKETVTFYVMIKQILRFFLYSVYFLCLF